MTFNITLGWWAAVPALWLGLFTYWAIEDEQPIFFAAGLFIAVACILTRALP